ncbi:MAG: site-2 protease family protein [Actinomycetia bacterium]|nr:site-2 protease family protein [Actinomycetes bacterium]
MLFYPSIKIGKIFGISIEINITWLVVFALIVYSLVFYEFPIRYRELSLIVRTADGFFTAFLLFVSVLLHELSHSLVAKNFGIEIKRITLFIFGGVAEMAGEPDSPSVEIKMAIAGPLMSFALSALFFLFANLLKFLGLSAAFYGPFEILSFINIALGIFNLFPGFPLDGGRILRAGLWAKTKSIDKATKYASWGGRILAGLLAFFGVFLFFNEDVSGLWLIFLGWFLNQAAINSYKQIRIQEKLSKIPVEMILNTEQIVIPGEISLEAANNQYFSKFRHKEFPVVDGSELVGRLSINDCKTVPETEWKTVRVHEVKKTVNKNLMINRAESAFEVMMRFIKDDIDQMFIVEGSRLIGVIKKSDIARLLPHKKS